MSENESADELTGAQSLIRSLERVGADVVFGIPGGAILPAYDPLFDSEKVRHILVRHEQGAGHAAEGYAMATGKVGVCMATSGPGATNLVTPIADAHMDSVPIVAITGQVVSAAIAAAIASAFHIAGTGRPGPVLVDITKDALQAKTRYEWPRQLDLPGYRPVTRPHGKQVREAGRLIAESRRPVLYVGGGVVKARAWSELKELAEMTGIPVITTLMARGVFPDSHPQNMGMPGMHGTVAAVGALQRSDLLISLGARFDDRVTGQLSSFAPLAKVIHADTDPAEISKNRVADVPIVGDCKEVIAELTTMLRAGDGLPDIGDWVRYLKDLKLRYPTGYDLPSGGELSPQHVIKRIGDLTGPDAYYAAGVGQHQMWASHFLPWELPGRWLNSGGLGTMGYCVPAAMGAKVGRPDSIVWGIDGDGCFQMTNQELVTCALEGIPIKIAVINNQSLGMVRQWQTLFYDSRYSNTDLKTNRIPDFGKLAEAMGCVGLRAEQPEDVDPVIEKALSINDTPVVVEFVVHKDAMVWPMVAAGTSNDEIKVARDMAPKWDGETL